MGVSGRRDSASEARQWGSCGYTDGMVPANRFLGVGRGRERIQQEKNWGHTMGTVSACKVAPSVPILPPPPAMSVRVCALEFLKIILFPTALVSHVSAPSRLSPLACLAPNKLKNKTPPAIPV